MRDDRESHRTRTSWLRLLLILPVAGVLWVPLFNRIEPAVFGIPFFYWWQLLWIVLCTVCIGIVYLAEHRAEATRP
jgi:membrane protein required for beta-lactamase induction